MVRLTLRQLSASLLAVGLALIACGASTTVSSVAGTATPAGCAALSSFAHATSASAGPRFTDVAFPTAAVSTSSPAPEANGFQYQVIHVCETSGTVASVTAFYASTLPSHGWTTTDTFPVAGDLSTACPSRPNCYIKNDGVIRFLTVESVTTSGSLTVYALRLVIQPYGFGGGLLNAGDTYDFDPTGPGGGTADITWNGSQIVPAGGAKLTNLGVKPSLNTVNYADVAALTYGTAALASDVVVPGDVFAVQTSDSHFVKVRVASRSGAQVSLDFVTYPYTF